ncbi:uncharacterized protein LOC122953859 [Acropora millepora]|uniref:uncharacterized protein LOC122953859 n=1 Tax=Acropora millepora TaxID=45264 RepID=UPI001CF2B515|nr:uncharacterized protein LOC122953859 [Acropora millepora]XP_044169792.1 uncharacterized protein LOC122953859 [Acropora millepora]XP_044169793.1 uncharacterized protein LOC122953859 [Acropora millepora]
MPPPKKKVHARFNVGAMMSKLKEARERNALEHEKVLTLSRDLQSKQAKVRRLQQKVDEVSDKENQLQAAVFEHPVAIRNRQLSPTSDEQGNVKISKRTITRRQTETLEQALKIHGGNTNNPVPAAVGLLETLCTKFTKKQLVTSVSRKRKFCESIFPQVYNTEGKKL